ncbi:transcriptional regulator with XRE-family HTH domain [Anaerosolibacter carboniphilus]|uniref:Transcriptional regulator with XRE-family HTH domain n=1 Tax=Anaerosolibacter carboniphilus TaxID=1417629 RepID=A0A841KXY8_9FIRM|nr:helix-turn-helix transcriptional regulator [Anaerosolibacter carboniphilus]MBB6218217.1 transcriptional regulator with XRE-family HTH domain [Anaerosolibacter carboniphilus]
MCVAELVKETRLMVGIQQIAIAGQVGVTQATWSKYENKELPMPDDVVERAAAVLNSPRIIAEHLYEKGSEFFNVPVLNNVDDNVLVVLDSLIEESAELIKHTQTLKKLLKNKKSRDQFSSQQWEEVMSAEEQIADVLPAIKLHFITMAEQFELDIKSLEKRMNRKLRSKSYKR